MVRGAELVLAHALVGSAADVGRARRIAAQGVLGNGECTGIERVGHVGHLRPQLEAAVGAERVVHGRIELARLGIAALAESVDGEA